MFPIISELLAVFVFFNYCYITMYMIYNITVYDDMGHLMYRDSTNNISLPNHISNFVSSKMKLYVDTDIETQKPQRFLRQKDSTGIFESGYRWHYLKPGLDNKFTYYCNNDIVNITYKLNKREGLSLEPPPAGESCTCS